jgi:hypothetical protein
MGFSHHRASQLQLGPLAHKDLGKRNGTKFKALNWELMMACLGNKEKMCVAGAQGREGKE